MLEFIQYEIAGFFLDRANKHVHENNFGKAIENFKRAVLFMPKNEETCRVADEIQQIIDEHWR